MNEADFVRKDVHDAQIETLAVAIDDTNSRIDDLKESVSRQLTLTGIMIGAFQIGLALVLYFLTKQ